MAADDTSILMLAKWCGNARAIRYLAERALASDDPEKVLAALENIRRTAAKLQDELRDADNASIDYDPD